MEELFNQYTKAFDTLNATAIADLYRVPCSISDGDGVNVYSNRQSLIDKFSHNCATMKSIGYKHSKFRIIDIAELGEDVKAVNIGWQVYTASSTFEFGGFYICHCIDGAWRIFCTNVYPGHFGEVTN